MKKGNCTCIYLLIVIIAMFYSCSKEEGKKWSKTQLHFISEEYNPFNYTENSQAKGLAPDLLKEVCNELGMDCSIEFMSWDKGYNTTLTSNNTVLFTTTLTSVRKDKFKWAGPIASLDWNFYSASNKTFKLAVLDDAKTVGKIGVMADYAMEQYLKEEGFTNLVYCTDAKDALTKLLKGEIDLFPSDKYTTEAILETMGKTVYSVVSQMTIKTELLYFAFNKNISDELVADFQTAIDKQKMNGTLKKLSVKYLHKNSYPDVLLLYTEPYPPLTFRGDNDEITGYGTDIVKEIMKRNNVCYDINLTSWSNSYQLALINPNFCIFTMDKTSQREGLFQWVGPIGTNTTWFYTKAGSGVTIGSVDQAKELSSIGAVNSWFSTQYMEGLGFTNLVLDSDPEALVKKLMKGEINAFVCSDVTFPDILQKAGYTYNGINAALSLMSSDYYIGFSLDTSVPIVNQWQSTLEAIKNDGTYDAIHKKWFQK